MIIEPTVIRTLDTRSLIAVTVSGSNGDNVGGTVTVSKDGTSYTTTTDSNGQCNIFVDSPGSWTVGYDKSGITASGSVSVVYSGYTYSVTLTIVTANLSLILSTTFSDNASITVNIYQNGTVIGTADKDNPLSAGLTLDYTKNPYLSVSSTGVPTIVQGTAIWTYSATLTSGQGDYIQSVKSYINGTQISNGSSSALSDGDTVTINFYWRYD